MSRYVKVTFPKGIVLIELLQTPAVEKWIKAYDAYHELNIPSHVVVDAISGFGNQSTLRKTQHTESINNRSLSVEKINSAIDTINSIIEGKKFPYEAYEEMPWMQTNRIHRCFITGLMMMNWESLGKQGPIHSSAWQHNLTQEQLTKCKFVGSKNMRHWLYENVTPQFKIFDNEIFNKAIHDINAYIHFYENSRFSQLSAMTIRQYIEQFEHSPKKIHVTWSKQVIFTEDNTCIKQEFHDAKFLQQINYEEMLSSFPDNYEDYNVSVLKSIGGKDYETCFEQYDDPLEFDIRNIQHITGSFTMYPNNEHYKFFTKTQFYPWIKNYRLRDELFLNVPIGKIVEDTVNINTIKTSMSDRLDAVPTGKPAPIVELI